MEKTLTINDIFYFVNQAMERGDSLKAVRYMVLENDDFWIEHKDFDIYCHYNNKKITITHRRNNAIELDVTDMEIAQFRVLWEKVKQYSQNMLGDKFLTYFKEEDNSEKTIDDIDD